MIRFGILCPSDIALRRFLPALQSMPGCKFMGVAVASPAEWFDENSDVSSEAANSQQEAELSKAAPFVDNYGGTIYRGYETLIKSSDVDVVYIPLPPALHYKWAKKVLENKKHAYVEKPFTTCLSDTEELIELAAKNNLALHENYMFVFHDQISAINKLIAEGAIGDVRQYRISFGFPRRAVNDFRYNKKLGGGALLDCGGYTLKYASLLLGESARILAATSCPDTKSEIDIFGSALLTNDEELTAQVSFGMDNDYKCELEVWGSTGTLCSGRVLTAPAGFQPSAIVKHNGKEEHLVLPVDDAFRKSIQFFTDCMADSDTRHKNYKQILNQSKLVEQFRTLSKKTE